MDYLAWNASTFNYFFNLESTGKDVLFSVDEDVIKHIARSNNILQTEALNDFCKCVASKIVKVQKAIEYSNKGHDIKIIKESDYFADMQDKCLTSLAH